MSFLMVSSEDSDLPIVLEEMELGVLSRDTGSVLRIILVEALPERVSPGYFVVVGAVVVDIERERACCEAWGDRCMFEDQILARLLGSFRVKSPEVKDLK